MRAEVLRGLAGDLVTVGVTAGADPRFYWRIASSDEGISHVVEVWPSHRRHESRFTVAIGLFIQHVHDVLRPERPQRFDALMYNDPDLRTPLPTVVGFAPDWAWDPAHPGERGVVSVDVRDALQEGLAFLMKFATLGAVVEAGIEPWTGTNGPRAQFAIAIALHDLGRVDEAHEIVRFMRATDPNLPYGPLLRWVEDAIGERHGGA